MKSIVCDGELQRIKICRIFKNLSGSLKKRIIINPFKKNLCNIPKGIIKEN